MKPNQVSQAEVRSAIKTILADTSSYSTSLNYAVGYCQTALQMSRHELAVQCLHILSNISHWRGAGAKEVRATLKAFSKQA